MTPHGQVNHDTHTQLPVSSYARSGEHGTTTSGKHPYLFRCTVELSIPHCDSRIASHRAMRQPMHGAGANSAPHCVVGLRVRSTAQLTSRSTQGSAGATAAGQASAATISMSAISVSVSFASFGVRSWANHRCGGGCRQIARLQNSAVKKSRQIAGENYSASSPSTPIRARQPLSFVGSRVTATASAPFTTGSPAAPMRRCRSSSRYSAISSPIDRRAA